MVSVQSGDIILGDFCSCYMQCLKELFAGTGSSHDQGMDHHVGV